VFFEGANPSLKPVLKSGSWTLSELRANLTDRIVDRLPPSMGGQYIVRDE
jgi:hypothetical protein